MFPLGKLKSVDLLDQIHGDVNVGLQLDDLLIRHVQTKCEAMHGPMLFAILPGIHRAVDRSEFKFFFS